ncbi:TPA: class I SAM-dependent methyltransferase, partial [Mannheimia haemolytica]|nr:class I SAM-dependent methyltransferase [Mannheimia haemolytica]HDL5780693.1 class I SAM-dependent methyltransferase [Mannheimia haemolytica]HDL5870180.1 class I SAM-dependent methyltransferase [Mannheimia haemolytica]HDL6072642.1 class I SAM-dependent methyltransferase [Mannheimia haemolytica]HDL6323373.1 class I SAM-dependent methyltransferase [Mannheimia haemolytica]
NHSNHSNHSNQSANQYIFNSDWFTHNVPSLASIFEYVKPRRILEIGSFEGRSSVFFIEEALKYQSQVEIHCIDSWEGGAEHQGVWDMGEIEQRFIHNVTLAQQKFQNVVLYKHRGYSHQKMIELLANGYINYFDYIYIDGSHEAPDVLFDALLAHRLVRKGGVISFDDYLWSPDETGKQRHY